MSHAAPATARQSFYLRRYALPIFRHRATATSRAGGNGASIRPGKTAESTTSQADVVRTPNRK